MFPFVWLVYPILYNIKRLNTIIKFFTLGMQCCLTRIIFHFGHNAMLSFAARKWSPNKGVAKKQWDCLFVEAHMEIRWKSCGEGKVETRCGNSESASKSPWLDHSQVTQFTNVGTSLINDPPSTILGVFIVWQDTYMQRKYNFTVQTNMQATLLFFS